MISLLRLCGMMLGDITHFWEFMYCMYCIYDRELSAIQKLVCDKLVGRWPRIACRPVDN